MRELRDYFVFSLANTALFMYEEYCAYGSAHSFSHLIYTKPSLVLVIRG